MKRFKLVAIFLLSLPILVGFYYASQVRTDIDADNILPSSYPYDQIINNVKVRTDTQSKNTKNKGKYIIKLRNDLSDKDKLDFLTKYGVYEDKLDYGKIATNRVLVNGIQGLTDSKYIESIEEDSTLETETLNVNDPSYKDQWYLPAISYTFMPDNQNAKQKVIAVLDSGTCINHPDLSGKFVEGWNFVNNNSDITDQNGHGCEISGIIAANTNNSLGIAGGSFNTKIMPLKVIDSDGTGSYSNLIDAIDYAVSKKVDVINISLGGYYDSNILHESIQKARSSGIIVVVSAGNTGNDVVMYPANYSEVFSVGSVENDYTISQFSSNSSSISLWAFGNSILTTTKDGNYNSFSGTSLATAEVSAFIAQGGQYKIGGIINYLSQDKKPVFSNNPISYSEPNSKLELMIPSGLNIEEFSNAQANQDTLINWERTIHLTRTESLVISVWTRKNSIEIDSLTASLKNQDRCLEKTNYCLINYPNIQGEYAYFITYLKNNNSVVRLRYNIDNLIGYNNFKSILSTIKISNQSISYKDFLSNMETRIKIPQYIIPQSEATCGYDASGNLFTDSSNEFNCCHPDSSGNYNFGNCVWYAEYKRHDLIGVVTNLNPIDWYNAAVNHNVPHSTDTPSVGAIAVWSGHVAYLEGVNTSSHTMTWSEQNCLTYWTDGQGVKHYGVNAFNASVSQSYPNSYGGTFLGYILPTSNSCSGNNPIMINWNVGGPLTCTPTGSLTIKPESHLTAGIDIKPN